MSDNITTDLEVDFLALITREVIRINDLDDEDVDICLDDDLVDDLDLDSLGMIELVLRIQAQYAVTLTEDEVKNAKTVRALLDLVERR